MLRRRRVPAVIIIRMKVTAVGSQNEFLVGHFVLETVFLVVLMNKSRLRPGKRFYASEQLTKHADALKWK